MPERILIAARSWLGAPLLPDRWVAVLREPLAEPFVDVLAPPWCAPIYQRMRGIRNIIENPVGHRELGLAKRRALAASLRQHAYTRVFILPNSFKSALIPWLARIPRRTGYVGEARGILLNDVRRLDRKASPRLVDRFVALAANPGEMLPTVFAPVLVPDAGNAADAIRALGLATRRPVAIFCPGAEYGPAKRWPTEHFVTLARRLIDSGYAVWVICFPNDPLGGEPLAALVTEICQGCGRR